MKSYFRQKIESLDNLLFAIVAVPTLISILYFGIFSSDIYISESRFVVRSPEKPAATGIGMILKSAGFANASDEISAANDHLTSRDALRMLNGHGAVAKAYGSSDISIFDRFNPLGWDGTFEDLYKYFEAKVRVEQDSATSITKLTVRAFTPQDAFRINTLMLAQSEAVVNRLNQRGREDLIRFSQVEVDEAEKAASDAAIALADYRNRKGVIDPEKQAAIQLQMISKLQDELISARTQLHQLRVTVPDNPQIEALELQVAALTQQIDEQQQGVAGGSQSLSATATQYQRLLLAREIADRNLASALNSLRDAQDEARRKQAYVERVVQPNLPDKALEPRRVRGILATLILSLIAWGVLRMLLAGVREHQN